MNAELKALDVEVTAQINELKVLTLYDPKRLKIISKLVELLTQQNELLKQKTDKIKRNEYYS